MVKDVVVVSVDHDLVTWKKVCKENRTLTQMLCVSHSRLQLPSAPGTNTRRQEADFQVQISFHVRDIRFRPRCAKSTDKLIIDNHVIGWKLL